MRTVCSFLFFLDGHCVRQEQLEGGTRAAKRRAATAAVSLMRRLSHPPGSTEVGKSCAAQRSTLATRATTPSPATRGAFEHSCGATPRLSCRLLARGGCRYGQPRGAVKASHVSLAKALPGRGANRRDFRYDFSHRSHSGISGTQHCAGIARVLSADATIGPALCFWKPLCF